MSFHQLFLMSKVTHLFALWQVWHFSAADPEKQMLAQRGKVILLRQDDLPLLPCQQLFLMHGTTFSLPAACMTAQLSKVTHLFALWKVWHLEPAREGRPASCTMISPFCSASSCFLCPAQLGKCDLCNARQYYCRMLTCM